MSTDNIRIITDEQNPEPIELIASSIIDLADGLNKLNNSRLKMRALVLILQDATGVKKTDIKKILNCAPILKSNYIQFLPDEKKIIERMEPELSGRALNELKRVQIITIGDLIQHSTESLYALGIGKRIIGDIVAFLSDHKMSLKKSSTSKFF